MRVEAVDHSAAVDVEGFEDLQDGIDGNAVGFGPRNYGQIFVAALEFVDDRFEQVALILKLMLQKSEIAAIEFRPEAFALQMFEPFCPQITRPMIAYPVPDGRFAEIVSDLFTLEPLELVFLGATVVVNAQLRAKVCNARRERSFQYVWHVFRGNHNRVGNEGR